METDTKIITLKTFQIKGKRSFGKKFFFSSPTQGNIERKSKLKKYIYSFISGLTNDFLEVQKVSSMVENGVFFDVINAVNN